MMMLIADSGSTKTDWVLLSPNDGLSSGSPSPVLKSQGINPYYQSRETIAGILRAELLPNIDSSLVESVYFYGSGVRPEAEAVMEDLLQGAFPESKMVEAHSDMLGAARALYGHNEGIASILGTGANSCLYDGSGIVRNMPALGYILGDEGSGAVLGKRFLHDLYGGKLSEEIVSQFHDETSLSLPDVITRVYRQPLANRFLASLSEFILRHINDPAIHNLVVKNFRDFLSCHIASYERRDLPVSFVGSIAWYYRDQLLEAAEREGFRVGTVYKSPLEGLLRYHLQV